MTDQEEFFVQALSAGVFGAGDSLVQPDGPVLSLPGVPEGLGPVIGTVKADGSAGDGTAAAGYSTGTVEFDTNVLFRLMGQNGGTAAASDPHGALPVAALPDLGSQTLGTALVSRSLPNVLEALAFDVVGVPVLFTAAGEIATRVFCSAGEDEPGDLCLFSSAFTLERFQNDKPDTYFLLQQGAAVVAYLGQQVDAIRDVVFDPAGPASLRIPAAVLASFLDPDPVTADEIIDQMPTELEPDTEVIRFDLNLNHQWGKIDLTDPAKWDHQIKVLVANQTRTLDDRAAGLRREMREWLSTVAEKAHTADGNQMAFLLARTKEAAAAISVVTYYHDLGQELPGHPHLDMVADYLLAKAGPEEEITRIDVAGDEMLRHARPGQGDPEIGGDAVPLWNIDYWLPAPDHIHMAHVSFSTPHVIAKDVITQLVDNVVLNGIWVIQETAAAPEETDATEEPAS